MGTGVIFDLDGTLLDTLADLRDAVNYALAQFGCPPRSLTQVRQFVGNGAELLIRRALPGSGTDPEPEAVLAVFRAYYNAHCQVKTQPYPGIPQVLAALGENYPLAVVSNKPDSAVKLLCRDYFPGLYARGEGADCPRKPAPDMVWAAMEALGVDRCIYVGDSEVDVATAKNAGVPCLSVLWGFRNRRDLEVAGAVSFCEAPASLPGDIAKMEEQLWQMNFTP